MATFYRLGPSRKPGPTVLYSSWRNSSDKTLIDLGPDYMLEPCTNVPYQHNRVVDFDVDCLELPSRKLNDLGFARIRTPIVSERFLQLLKHEGISGFREVPVIRLSIKRYRGSDFPKVWSLRITGSGGYEKPRPERRFSEKCPVCGHRVMCHNEIAGDYIDPDSWDGSDIFRGPDWGGHVFVTQRLADLIIENQIQHCNLTPAELTTADRVVMPELSH